MRSPTATSSPWAELRDPEQSVQCSGHLADFVTGVVSLPVEGTESPADCRRAPRDVHPRGLDVSCRRHPQSQRGARPGRGRRRHLDRVVQSADRRPVRRAGRDRQGDCRRTAADRGWQKRHTTRPDLRDLYMRAQLLEMGRDRESATPPPANCTNKSSEAIPVCAGVGRPRQRPANLARPDTDSRAGPDEAAAQKAIQLDANLAEAQAARANVFVLQQDWPLAERPSSAPSSSIPARPRAT